MNFSSWTDEQQAIWQVIAAFNRAFADNDVERYFSFLDDDLIVITPSNPYRVEGLAADREEFEYSLERGTTRVNYFQELQPQVRVIGDAAFVTYYSRGSYGQDAARTVYLKETDILSRINGEWKIVHIHISKTV